MNRVPMTALLASAVFVGLSCDSGPRAGELAVSLATPQTDDRAIMFQVDAQEGFLIESVSAACTGCQAFFRHVTDTQVKAIVHGPLGSGIVAQVSVSDTEVRTAYTLLLLEVAGPDLGLRSISARQLAFEP